MPCNVFGKFDLYKSVNDNALRKIFSNLTMQDIQNYYDTLKNLPGTTFVKQSCYSLSFVNSDEDYIFLQVKPGSMYDN